MSEVIELTKHARLVIAPDPNPIDPRVPGDVICGTYTPPWDALWGFATEGPAPLYEFPGRIVEAVEKFEREFDDELLERWAWVTHNRVVHRHGRSFWYCDENMFNHLHGGPFDRENQAAVIEAEAAEYEAFIRGDARVVTFQRLAQFKRVTRKYHEKQEDLLEVWENVAYVGDVYFSVGYSAADVAYDQFFGAMTRKEQAVLTAMVDQQRAERALPTE
jgi:hypothetical protein